MITAKKSYRYFSAGFTCFRVQNSAIRACYGAFVTHFRIKKEAHPQMHPFSSNLRQIIFYTLAVCATFFAAAGVFFFLPLPHQIINPVMGKVAPIKLVKNAMNFPGKPSMLPTWIS